MVIYFGLWNEFWCLCSSARSSHAWWKTNQVSLAQQPTIHYMSQQCQTKLTARAILNSYLKYYTLNSYFIYLVTRSWIIFWFVLHIKKWTITIFIILRWKRLSEFAPTSIFSKCRWSWVNNFDRILFLGSNKWN